MVSVIEGSHEEELEVTKTEYSFWYVEFDRLLEYKYKEVN